MVVRENGYEVGRYTYFFIECNDRDWYRVEISCCSSRWLY